METARDAGQGVLADDTGPGLATGFLPGRPPRWSGCARPRARLSVAFSQAHPDRIGRRFGQLAAELGMEPSAVLLQILTDEGEGLDRITVNGRLFDEAQVRPV